MEETGEEGSGGGRGEGLRRQERRGGEEAGERGGKHRRELTGGAGERGLEKPDGKLDQLCIKGTVGT